MTWGSHASRLVAGAPARGTASRSIDRQVKLRSRGLRPHRHLDRHQRPVLPRVCRAACIAITPSGACPLDSWQVRTLETLTGVALDRRRHAASELHAARRSAPAWRGFRTRAIRKYREALAILRAGKAEPGEASACRHARLHVGRPARVAQQCKYDALRQQLEGGKDQKTP